MESEARLQLGELVIRPNTEDLPDGKVWVENPQLHLTALYFMQEMRRQEKPELTEELKGLQEEILVNYGRGRFIVAVHKEKRNADAQTEERRCISADFHRYPGVSKIQ